MMTPSFCLTFYIILSHNFKQIIGQHKGLLYFAKAVHWMCKICTREFHARDVGKGISCTRFAQDWTFL